jgi:hypothetical protein
VDLVDEEDVARCQVREHRGEVTGSLDRRTTGDLHRGAQLGADDQGEAGLAQPGRPRQQHVVRRAPPALGALQHERQLAGDLRLPDELRERVRPQGRLDDPLLVPGERGDAGVLAEAGVDRAGE